MTLVNRLIYRSVDLRGKSFMSNQLNGVVTSAPNKSKGFDIDNRLSLEDAQNFYKEGYRFCLRYISRKSEASEDLSYEEASAILEGGLALMPVQHVLDPGWHPTASLGREYGENAAENTFQIGFPTGVNVWCDLEGINSSVPVRDVIDYCNAWYEAVAANGYLPGLYVGYDAILSGEQLYQALKFKHYWKSVSDVPNIPTRGYQMIQTAIDENVYINGKKYNIDKNTSYIDNENGQPQWLVNGNFFGK